MSVLSSYLEMQIYELSQTQIPIIKKFSGEVTQKVINESNIKPTNASTWSARSVDPATDWQRLAQD